MARTIVLVTGNLRKLAEYRDRLSQYGVQVVQGDKATPPPDHLGSEAWAVLKESSDLYAVGGGRIPPTGFDRSRVATNRCELRCWRPGERGPTCDVYLREIPGYVDPARRQRGGGEVFDWDDVFVERDTGRTYHQMKRRGLKLSARDLVIGDFAREHLYYDGGITLRWAETILARSVDFAVDPVAFFDGHPVYAHLPQGHPLRAVAYGVLAEGVFFRSAKNRREKNYWLPGLNAGIPLVPKRDAVHEATFMFHDLMHFAFPDLLFDGGAGPAHRNAYIAHRMMSEAFTLVLADMIFVEAIRGGFPGYDFTRRRIWPLWDDLGLDPADLDDVEAVLWANASYCLRGDAGPYRELGASEEALAAFTGKYRGYFVADYQWTRQNYDNVAASAPERFTRWLEVTAPMRPAGETVGAFLAGLKEPADLEGLVEAVFQHYIERLRTLWGASPRPSAADCLQRGFARYMAGQAMALVVYDFLPEAEGYLAALLAEMQERPPRTLEDARRVRGLLDQFFELLYARRVISEDDMVTYKEVFPFFDPHYVNYDLDNAGVSLRDAALEALELRG